MKSRTIIDDININGVTMNYIMRKQKGLFFDAFNTMNYFIANPSVTEEFRTTSEKIFRRFNWEGYIRTIETIRLIVAVPLMAINRLWGMCSKKEW